MVPSWLHTLSLAGLALGVACALVIAVDEFRHPQRMWIMNVVWPVVAVFGTVLTAWAYFAYARLTTRDKTPGADVPFPVMVGKGAAHCGSGCTLGDICAEWLAFAVPAVALPFGWHWLFGEKMYAVWALDYVFAFLFGIAFQYFTIAPMRDDGVARGLRQAIKTDALSLTAWQIGMYGFMWVANFHLFRGLIGLRLRVDSAEFWFMMQIAMLCGFATSYPVNWWLLRTGAKESM